MIQIGRNIRWETPYETEVAFSKAIGCSFMQLWYYRGDIMIESQGRDKIDLIKNTGFPVVFHAVIDILEFEQDLLGVMHVLESLGLKELIIHPNSKIQAIDDQSIYVLKRLLSDAGDRLDKKGIKLYVENNCRISPINYSSRDVAILYEGESSFESLLDIAHVDSYEHMQSLIDVKMPKMLHLADKNFSVDHQHLPIGQGELDFSHIFETQLKSFQGKLILEIDQSDLDIKASVEKLRDLLGKRLLV